MSSPLEVAIGALEEIRDKPWGRERSISIASRALATIRAGSGLVPAKYPDNRCSYCGLTGWHKPECRRAASRPREAPKGEKQRVREDEDAYDAFTRAAQAAGEAKATGEVDEPEHDEWCGDELKDGTILRCNHCNPPGTEPVR